MHHSLVEVADEAVWAHLSIERVIELLVEHRYSRTDVEVAIRTLEQRGVSPHGQRAAALLRALEKAPLWNDA